MRTFQQPLHPSPQRLLATRYCAPWSTLGISTQSWMVHHFLHHIFQSIQTAHQRVPYPAGQTASQPGESVVSRQQASHPPPTHPPLLVCSTLDLRRALVPLLSRSNASCDGGDCAPSPCTDTSSLPWPASTPTAAVVVVMMMHHPMQSNMETTKAEPGGPWCSSRLVVEPTHRLQCRWPSTAIISSSRVTRN